MAVEFSAGSGDDAALTSKVLGFVALVLASVNIVGGFLVTQRMLGMYKKKETKRQDQKDGRGDRQSELGDSALGEALHTLADYLRPGLQILSIGLNPSLGSVEAGFYFANPRNRFWPALLASGLAPPGMTPGAEGIRLLYENHGMGFTDVVKRPSAGGGSLRAADFRRFAPSLRDKLLEYRPRVAWFHGKQAYHGYLRYGEDRPPGSDWGEQPNLAACRVFVTPNPSPANAAYSLIDLTEWYRRLAAFAEYPPMR